MYRLFWNLIVVITLLTGTIAGCGKSGPPMYQVSGKLHYKDGSLPKAGIAMITFMPSKDSTAEMRRNASGTIGPDGSFTMSTRVAGDGVYAGDYNVLLNVIKSPVDPTSLVLPKYYDPNDPPYRVTVDQDITGLEYTMEPLPGVRTK
jgi:hypothetical protein